MALLALLPRKTILVKVTFVGAFFTALTLLKTYPLIRHFGTQLLGDPGDTLLNSWILAWDVHALTTDPFNLLNANIFYPVQNALALSEHMIAVVPFFFPAYSLTGNPIFAYNAVFFSGIHLLGHHYVPPGAALDSELLGGSTLGLPVCLCADPVRRD
jgi:hypothetical protein